MQQARGPDLRRLHTRAAQGLHPGRRQRSDPDRMPPQEPDLEIHELAERAGHRVQSGARDRRHRLGLHRDHPLPGIVGGRRAQEGIRLGERGIDDLGVIATTAAPPQRRGRRLWIACLGERDEVVGDADDPKRPRDLLPGDVRRHPVAVPPRHQLAERTGHPVGHPQAPGQQAGPLAEAGRHHPELLLAADQLPGDQLHPLRKRPVVSQPAHEVGQHLARLRRRPEHLSPTLEPISSPPTQLAR
jgi:hypothetical protein